MNEHDAEPIRGLPARLPAGEVLLWQGAPRWTVLARRVFHVPVLAVYFGVFWLARVVVGLSAGDSLMTTAVSGLWLLTLALAAIGVLAVIAWLMGRTTIYTVTSRRVVIRLGVALSMTLNIPFRIIESASVKMHADGTGDIPLSLHDRDRIAYLQLWPHARPWRIARPQPMLRAVPEASRVAGILAQALQAASTRTASTANEIEQSDARPRAVA